MPGLVIIARKNIPINLKQRGVNVGTNDRTKICI